MSEENTKQFKSIAIKVIIPVMLICVVAAIWAVKNKFSAGMAITLTI